MQLTCILGAFWATQMEAGLVCIQANIVMIGDFDHTIQRHGLGFFKCFLTTYWNYMVGDNCGLTNITEFGLRISHPSFFKTRNSCGHMFNNSLKMGTCELFVATHLD
jgi:hypothetical protein